MKARDVMSVDVVAVGPDDTVTHAAHLMLTHHISGLPVVAADGVVMGIVTEGDMLRRAELRASDTWLRSPASPRMKSSVEDYIKGHATRVSDIMSKEVVTADDDAPLHDLAELMARHNVKRILIVRGERVIGIVSRTDLIRGFVTAEGFERAPTDAKVRRDVLNRLHVELELPRSDVGATIRDGKVILWGVVDDERALKAAHVAAESVPGVTSVVSYLRVEAPQAPRSA